MVYHPRSQPEPQGLTHQKTLSNGNYNQADVISTLRDDFCNKCYICEQKNPTSINIEHLIPHCGDDLLRLEWSNLFYCCTHCNNTKLAKQEFHPVLDCTILGSRVTLSLKLTYLPFPDEKILVEADSSIPNVIATSKLLHAVYNGTTAQKKIESNNLRTLITGEMVKFRKLLVELLNKTEGSPERFEALTKVKGELQRDTAFTAIKFWEVIRLKEQFIDDEYEQLYSIHS